MPRLWKPRRLLWSTRLLVAIALSALPGPSAAKPPGRAGGDAGGHHGAPPRVDDPAPGCRANVLGPLTLTRSTGKPRVDAISFSTPDASAPHFLRIDNGGSGGEMRPVSSALVVLGGRRILGPERFNPFVRTLEEAIAVQGDNQLLFRLAGKPGSGFAFEVFAIDEKPPTLLEISPPDGTTVSRPEVTLSIRAQDLLSDVTDVTCAGALATAVDDEFACTTPLQPGANAIEIVATDACGNASSTSHTIVFDPPPVVSIESPENGHVFFRGPVVVQGTVDDPTAQVSVNGVAATGAPTFTATVPVGKGENTLRAVARDAAGGEGSDSVEITVLTGPFGPTLKISSPGPDFLVGGPDARTNVPVQGRVRVGGPFGAGNAPSVSVNGQTAAVRQSSSPGLFCSSLDICWWDFVASIFLRKDDNPNLIEAIGTDPLGGTDSASVSGRVDICVVGRSTGNALAGGADGQSNRCHDIDGCSTPDFVVPDVQDPAQGRLGRRSTAFGKDTLASEQLPHGVAPRDDLPCNHHDVCYQTCGAKKVPCDADMFDRMTAVCGAAYPETSCPFLPDLAKCVEWRREKDRCYAWASRYKSGLATPPALQRFIKRQGEFCHP